MKLTLPILGTIVLTLLGAYYFCANGSLLNSTLLDTVFPIIMALIGGGAVTFIYEKVNESKKSKLLRHLIIYEIKRNVEALKALALYKDPWMPQDLWISFYDSNPNAIVAFENKDKAEQIIRFYEGLQAIRRFDAETKREIEEVKQFQRHQIQNPPKGNPVERLWFDSNETGIAKMNLVSPMIKLGEEIIADK